MFGVYCVYDGTCGDEETLMDTFATEAEAEDYMAQLIADDVEFYGEQCDEYYVGEVD
jgi:hypothetical protein